MVNISLLFFNGVRSLHGLKTTSIFGVIGFVGLSNLLLANPAHSFNVTFENADFENGFNSWTTVGDTSIQGDFEGQLQYQNNQAVISTGCPNTVTGRCFDQQNNSNARNDDTTSSFNGSESSGDNYFNFSGNSQINADGSGYTGTFSDNLLQDFGR